LHLSFRPGSGLRRMGLAQERCYATLYEKTELSLPENAR
jgi:hypothetical protein